VILPHDHDRSAKVPARSCLTMDIAGKDDVR
jgi:hypothetical protein